MLINVSEDVAHRLEALAEEHGSTVNDLLTSLLNRYAPAPPVGTLAEMAQNALEAGLASDKVVNTAENSRQILNTERDIPPKN